MEENIRFYILLIQGLILILVIHIAIKSNSHIDKFKYQ